MRLTQGRLTTTDFAQTGGLRPIAAATRLLCGALLLCAAGVQAQTGSDARENAEAVLPTVKVKASRAAADDLPAAAPGGQVARGARLGLLGNVDVMDTPFNVSSYTAELIQDKQARSLADVLGADPSVRFTTSSGHPNENFRIRGFDVNQNDVAFNGMFGVLPLGHVPLEFVERVEVLKGPNALFSGMAPSGAVGGVINLVPKRAGDEPLNRASFSLLDSGQAGLALDLGRRFGERGQWGLRSNAAYSDGEGLIDGRKNKRELLSLALDLREGALRASADLYSVTESFRGGMPAMYWFSGAIPAAPKGSANQFPAAQGRQKSQGLVLRAEYQFTPRLAGFASAGLMKHDYSGFISGSHVRNLSPEGLSRTSATYAQLGHADNRALEAGLRLNLETGAVVHELVLQASQLNQEAGAASRGSSPFSTSIYQPTYTPMPAGPDSAPKTSENRLSSLALVDSLSMWGDSLRLTLGLRHQRVKTSNFVAATGALSGTPYDKSATTPALGLVFKPWGPDLAFYANYVEGLSKGDSVSKPTYAIDHTFAPYKTRQREAGIKWQHGGWTNTAALFQIDKPMLITLADKTPSDGGEKRVRGLEWNTSGALSPQLRLLGGAVYTRGTQTETGTPALNGLRAVGAPKLQANLGLDWDTPFAPGLSLSAHTTASSGQFVDAANTQRIPGWGVLELGARYRTRLDGRVLVLRLSASNVSNKAYYNGSFSDTTPIATLGAPRSVSASATLDF